MTIKEKAKAYDEAIERAREAIKNNPDFVRVTPQLMEEIFPELKESEEDRIRKKLITYFQDLKGGWFGDISHDNIIAWLEKQGEQREQLINKACELLVNCIEDFMLRRMEVWNGECKKQTLENIRKKLEE